MKEKILALARMTSEPRYGDLDKQLAKGVARAQAELHGHGRLFVVLAELYKEEISRRAQIGWESVIRAHKSVGAPLSDDLRNVLEAAMRADLDAVLTSLRPTYDKAMEKAPRSEKIRDWAGQLGDQRDHELKRYLAEIEHYVSSLESARERGSMAPTSYVFHGPVGAVVSGAGASANVVQNITSAQRDEVLRALGEIGQLIARSSNLPENERKDLGELVEEGAAEIKKDRPNGRRLSMVFQTLASTVQAIANGPQAGEVLRAAAVTIGLGW